MTTEELVKRCINKEKSAWDKFIREYEGLVKKSVLYKLKKLNLRFSRDEVVDIVQEIFLLIWEKDKLALLREDASLKGWLAIVSVNITSNYCKKHIFKAQNDFLSFDNTASGDFNGPDLKDIIPSEKFNTEKSLERNEIKSIIDREVSSLPARQQLALKFNIYDGEKQRDIARIMNIPEGTVATLIKRGKETLRKKLQIHLSP